MKKTEIENTIAGLIKVGDNRAARTQERLDGIEHAHNVLGKAIHVRFETVASQIGALTGRVEELKTGTTNILDKVSDLQEKLSTLETTVSVNATIQDKTSQRLSTLNQNINVRLETIGKQISEMRAGVLRRIDALEGVEPRLERLVRAQPDALEGRIDAEILHRTIENLKALETTVSVNADKLAELRTRVEETVVPNQHYQQEKISKLEDLLSSLEETTTHDYHVLTAQTETLTTTISALEEKLSKSKDGLVDGRLDNFMKLFNDTKSKTENYLRIVFDRLDALEQKHMEKSTGHDVPSTKTQRSGWMNIYPEKVGMAVHPTRDEADRSAAFNRIKCVEVFWEE